MGDPTHRTKMATNKFEHILAADFLWIYFTNVRDPTHRTKMARIKVEHILAADFLWIYFTNWQESKKPKTRGFSWSFNGMRKVGV